MRPCVFAVFSFCGLPSMWSRLEDHVRLSQHRHSVSSSHRPFEMFAQGPSVFVALSDSKMWFSVSSSQFRIPGMRNGESTRDLFRRKVSDRRRMRSGRIYQQVKPKRQR